MQEWHSAFLTINLFSFVSTFTFDPLGARGADWSDVSLTENTSISGLVTMSNISQHFQNKSLFTLTGTLWTEIKKVPFNEAFSPTAKANERKS